MMQHQGAITDAANIVLVHRYAALLRHPTMMCPSLKKICALYRLRPAQPLRYATQRGTYALTTPSILQRRLYEAYDSREPGCSRVLRAGPLTTLCTSSQTSIPALFEL